MRITLAAALLCLGGCLVDVDYDGTGFLCEESAVCPEGQVCVEGRCAPGEAIDAGADTDGGAGDAGPETDAAPSDAALPDGAAARMESPAFTFPREEGAQSSSSARRAALAQEPFGQRSKNER